jgi:hypothetical protein
MLGLVAAIVLFLIVLFMLPKMVGGARDLCNSRGYRNATDGLCTCVSGYHGEACEYSKAFGRVYMHSNAHYRSHVASDRTLPVRQIMVFKATCE